jgi:hypothetical protein
MKEQANLKHLRVTYPDGGHAESTIRIVWCIGYKIM